MVQNIRQLIKQSEIKLNFNKSPDRIKLFALLIVETFSFLKQLTYVKSSFWIMLLYILS
jgi:hypothetical protein